MLLRARALFPVSAALGFVAWALAVYALAPQWGSAVPLKPLADWLYGHAHPTLAGYWALVWLNVPYWLTSVAGDQF